MEDWFRYRWSEFPYGIWVSVNADGRLQPNSAELSGVFMRAAPRRAG